MELIINNMEYVNLILASMSFVGGAYCITKVINKQSLFYWTFGVLNVFMVFKCLKDFWNA